MAEIIRAFGSKAFDAVTMTEEVNKAPYVPGFLQGLKLATEVPIYTPDFAIGKEEGKLNLIQSVPRGAPATNRTPTKRDIRTFNTVRLPQESTIYGHELQKVLAGQGKKTLVTLQKEVMKRNKGMDDDLNATEENHLLGAVQGLIMDADGTSVLYDWFDEWGIVPAATIDFDLANSSLEDIQRKMIQLKRGMNRSQKGMRWNGGLMGLMGDGFTDAFVANPEINKTMLNQSAASRLVGDVQAFPQVDYFGCRWVNYRGTDDNSSIKIADDEVAFFPYDPSSKLFQAMRAPHHGMDDLGGTGKRRYNFKDMDPTSRKEWVRIALETFVMYVSMRPEMLRKGTV